MKRYCGDGDTPVRPHSRWGACSRIARFLAGILAWAPLAALAGSLPLAEDFQRDARQMRGHGQPMVVMFSQNGCVWCDRVRTQIGPMATDEAQPDGALFRQVNIDSDAALVGFDGRPTSHREFAQTQGVQFTPMLVFFGPDGEQLADAIVGMTLPDFYAQYVTHAIDRARGEMGWMAGKD